MSSMPREKLAPIICFAISFFSLSIMLIKLVMFYTPKSTTDTCFCNASHKTQVPTDTKGRTLPLSYTSSQLHKNLTDVSQNHLVWFPHNVIEALKERKNIPKHYSLIHQQTMLMLWLIAIPVKYVLATQRSFKKTNI